MEFAEKTDQVDQIEEHNESNYVSFVSSKAASWPILLGSIDDTVVCESSLSPVDSDGNSTSSKSALVLRRPSPDCGPCEIKISFEQKHEIRQVYIRSTARVYEIYYAADIQSMNEYLCTVRCGMAAKTEECSANKYLQNMGAATSTSPSSTGLVKLLDELKTDSGGSTNEDGWVEIKDPDPFLPENGGDRLDSTHSNKSEVHIERENQDFYEATAELSDVSPCMSMTIRLLSLQSGESVYIDEVYVFADPVEYDADSTSKEVGYSTGNSLMSMLVPTLLQLSKSQMTQISEQHDPTLKLKKANLDVSRNMSSASNSAKIQKEEIPPVSKGKANATDKLECSDQSANLEVPIQTSNMHDKSGTTNTMNESTYHIANTLDQLVTRIARIEQFCLNFEQRMINPITSMDARLGVVEQQLKSLNEKFQLPEMHSSTKPLAPDLSRSDSDSEFSSFGTDGIIIPNCKGQSFEKDDGLSDEVPAQAPSSDIPSSGDASVVPILITAPEVSISSETLGHDNDDVANNISNIPSIATARAHLVPSLVVTAPEFSCGEEEENDDSNSVEDPQHDKLKKPLSIDDALAFALAGFVSSTSKQDSTSAFDPNTLKTDYDDEKEEANIIASPHVKSDEPVVTIEAATENGEHDVLFSSNSEKTVDVIAGHDQILEEESAHNSFVHDVENQTVQAEKTAAEVETVITEEDCIGNDERDVNKVDFSSGEMAKKEDSSVLHRILELPINSVVDYKIPILDVQFASRESSNMSSSIEALLNETAKTGVGSSSSLHEKEGGYLAAWDYSLESENVEVGALEAIDQLLVDLGNDDSSYLSHNNSNQDVSMALL